MGAFFSTIELFSGYMFGVYELPLLPVGSATLPPGSTHRLVGAR